MATQVCEKHRLRYDPETQAGCVVCRREAAAASGAAMPGGAPPASGPSPAAVGSESETDLVRPLAVAASIWLVSALVLYAAHREIAAVYVASGAEPEAAVDEPGGPDPLLGTEPAPGTAAGQSEAVLEELRALQGDEPVEPGVPGVPPAIPSSEQLSPDPGPVDDEHPSAEPVVIETGEPDGGGPGQP